VNVLVTGLFYPASVCDWLARGFAQNGAHVVTAGIQMGARVPGMDGWIDIRAGHRAECDLPYLNCTQPAYMEICQRAGVKFNLVVQCSFRWQVQGVTTKHVCVASENHHIDYDASRFDLVFGGTSTGYGCYAKNFRWMMGGYDQGEHSDFGLPRQVDVCLVGSLSADRWRLLSTLSNNGFLVSQASGLVWDEYNAAYNGALMALVLSVGDIPMRVMEHMAQGCLVLMNRDIEDIGKSGLKEGVHFLGYDQSDPASLVSAAERGLHAGARGKIVAAAKQWVAPQTWATRCKTIVAEVGL
jgi:hypothetical protein